MCVPPDGEAFRAVFRLGWPIGMTNLAETGLFAASSLMVGWIGTVELADGAVTAAKVADRSLVGADLADERPRRAHEPAAREVH